ncbi:small conductance mechanosensitive channel [Seinonella peptonophila]|uniref:Small conductance mechanosensitive channel n=1 Tax=Seinonella peptonophila TaxID=112248 RepID=A0A1M5A5M1_9BACL|nr:mechanosensitive ion channel family protein [Seinonella peptonophila]SHF25571.1 small conductance mechanosensitive channel [Seinonella peptonophila]
MFQFSKWNFQWAPIAKSLITSALILVIAFILYAILKVVIHRLLIHKGKHLGGNTQHRLTTLQSLLSNIIFYTIFFIAIVAILDQFHINAAGFVASAGILGLAVGFGAKDLVSDMVTGFFMLIEDQVKVGELVTVATFTGIVEAVGLRLLKLRDLNGDLHFIPNRDVRTLTNHSRGNKQVLVDLEFPITTHVNDSTQSLQSICDQLAQQMKVITEGPHVVGVQTLNANEYSLRIIAKAENGSHEEVERELRKQITEYLHKEQIQEEENKVVVSD